MTHVHRELFRNQEQGKPAVLGTQGWRMSTGEMTDQGEVETDFHGSSVPSVRALSSEAFICILRDLVNQWTKAGSVLATGEVQP